MSTSALKIMIIDDEPIAVEAIKSGVDWERLQVFNVVTAYNIIDARDILQGEEVDVMLCDIEMPGGSGLDLTKWVNEMYPNTICIFLTCHSDFTYARQAVALNAFDYLLKPIDYQELTAILQKAIARRKELISGERARAVISDLAQKAAKDKVTESAATKIVEEVKTYILENISYESLDCKAVAQHVFLNQDYLSRLFKAQTNMSLKGYIIKTRMSLACELLTGTTLSVSKIAMSCGYSHMAHFSKMFKQETGLTPYEYRNTYHK